MDNPKARSAETNASVEGEAPLTDGAPQFLKKKSKRQLTADMRAKAVAHGTAPIQMRADQFVEFLDEISGHEATITRLRAELAASAEDHGRSAREFNAFTYLEGHPNAVLLAKEQEARCAAAAKRAREAGR